MARRGFLVWTIVLAGCGSDPTGLTPDPPLVEDPNDPLICVGDPDKSIICKKQSEFWDCTAMPNGDVKCAQKEGTTPGGGATWSCKVVGDAMVCTTTTPDVPGTGGWTCKPDGAGGTVCEKPIAPPPPGGGSYNCGYENEFLVCTGKPTTPPPTTPPPTTPPPPNTSNTVCYEAPAGSTTTVVPPEGTWAKLVVKKATFNGVPAVYARLTLSKAFVDNTYGAYAIAWGDPTSIGKKHSFQDLVESDKNEFFISDLKGNLVMDFNLDYISPSSKHPSGYGCLGVSGGEGGMLKGNASDVLAAQTSLGVNFNDYGYKLTVDSPKTDLKYTPDPAYPKWIFEVWYEFWVRWDAFGKDGPGKVYITALHASPNKLGVKGSFPMTPVPCP